MSIKVHSCTKILFYNKRLVYQLLSFRKQKRTKKNCGFALLLLINATAIFAKGNPFLLSDLKKEGPISISTLINLDTIKKTPLQNFAWLSKPRQLSSNQVVDKPYAFKDLLNENWVAKTWFEQDLYVSPSAPLKKKALIPSKKNTTNSTVTDEKTTKDNGLLPLTPLQLIFENSLFPIAENNQNYKSKDLEKPSKRLVISIYDDHLTFTPTSLHLKNPGDKVFIHIEKHTQELTEPNIFSRNIAFF